MTWVDKKFPARPHFEDDKQIVEAFTAYGRAQKNQKAAAGIGTAAELGDKDK